MAYEDDGKLQLSKEWFDFLCGLGGPCEGVTSAGCPHNGDAPDGRNCAETQTGVASDEGCEARLNFMFGMHREFMRRYEDLVQDRDRWQALAEKNNGR